MPWMLQPHKESQNKAGRTWLVIVPTCSIHPLDHVCPHEADVGVPGDNVSDDLRSQISGRAGGGSEL